ncbi:hypothetical protein Cfor_08257 [Coptotermes formosanus]|uniref:Uncharacterized protein n=1 Tax=Coptotermes formosanus TaxID=36987 RepID=A0A6L2P7L7_COPFO|nr:hypothetical protein Cfor_08257 [Coptotermes formosanus]
MKRYLFFVVFLTVSICFCGSVAEDAENKILTRKRRYLTFPAGSTFVVTLSNTKGLMWDVPTFGRPPWNNIMEFDLVFKLPNMTEFFSNYKIASRENDGLNQSHHQHRRDRSQFYRQLEDVLDVQGEDGRTCIYRALCEAKYLLKPGRSFVEDVLHVLFTFPRGNGEDAEGYEIAGSQDSCMTWSTECPYSLLRPTVT